MPQFIGDGITFNFNANSSDWPTLSCNQANRLALTNSDLQVEATRILRFQGDGHLSAQGTLIFSTGSPTPSEKMRVLADGKVGIGTTSPSQALEVNGAVKATDFIKGTTALVSSQWVTGKGGINFGGNVGIGTDAPSARLHVIGALQAEGNLRVTGDTKLEANLKVAGIANLGGDTEVQGNLRVSGRIDAAEVRQNGVRLVSSQWNTITGGIHFGGRVGIGTTSPGVKLHIVGGTDVEADNQGGYLMIGNLDGANIAMDDNEILARNNSQKSILHFQANGGDIHVHSKQSGTNFIIKDNGFVGIGISNPSTLIHVRGGATCNGARWIDNSSLANKKNVAALSLDEALATLAGLNAITFTYKAVPEAKRCVGFIAEDVPELVADANRQGLSAMDIVGVLTKVVQHQQQEIALLRTQLQQR